MLSVCGFGAVLATWAKQGLLQQTKQIPRLNGEEAYIHT
jgi:hypothetical protein